MAKSGRMETSNLLIAYMYLQGVFISVAIIKTKFVTSARMRRKCCDSGNCKERRAKFTNKSFTAQ